MEPHRVVSIVPRGTALGRFVQTLIVSRAGAMDAIEYAKGWRDTPQVAECFKAAELSWETKASVYPGTIADATWASPLAAYGIEGEAIELLRGASLLAQIAPRFRRVPFRVNVPRESGAGTGGAWVGEGAPVPLAKTSYDLLSQEAYKAQTIVALSKELTKTGPASEATVRDTVIGGIAAFLDSQFLTPTVAAINSTQPAAITNGATAVSSTGSTAAQIVADLASLIGSITTPGSSLVWVMRPITAYAIAAKLAGVGMATDIPRTLLGIPLVLSSNSPQQITLIDCASILYSDDNGFDVSVTEQATFEMEAPATSPATASTVFTSAWQQNLVAIKVTRWLAYRRAQAGGVAYMTVTY